MVESVYAKVLEASTAEPVIPWHVDEPTIRSLNL